MMITENIHLIKKYQTFLSYTLKTIILFILLAIFILLLIILLYQKNEKNEYSQEATTIWPLNHTIPWNAHPFSIPMYSDGHGLYDFRMQNPLILNLWLKRIDMFCFITCKKNPPDGQNYCNCDANHTYFNL